MTNEKLLAMWKQKLPNVEPTNQELTSFALGVEVGAAVVVPSDVVSIQRQAFIRGWDERGMAHQFKGTVETDERMRALMDTYFPRTAAAATQPALQQEASPTAGMNIAQRILHVGGRNNAAGYVEFGSIQAVEALVKQVLRDLQAPQPSPAGMVNHKAQAIPCVQWQCGPQASGFTAPKADQLQPVVALQEKAGMYADDFAPPADSGAAPEGATLVENGYVTQAGHDLLMAATRASATLIHPGRVVTDAESPTPQADSVTAPAGGVADDLDAIALARYKVVPAHESMFHRFAVVAGDGKQQLYLGREVECENMARKFAGAFLDGAFYQSNIAPTPPAAQGDAQDAARLDWLEADEMNRVFRLGKSWYTRASYRSPYRKRASLREAIDTARAAQEGK